MRHVAVLFIVLLIQAAVFANDFWSNKSFEVVSLAPSEYDTRNFRKIDLWPTVNNGIVELYGYPWVANSKEMNLFGPFNHGIDTVKKVIDDDDFVLFCDFVSMKRISKTSVSFVSQRNGVCPVFVASEYFFKTNNNYSMFYLVFEKKQDSLLVLKKIDNSFYLKNIERLRFSNVDSLQINGCMNDRCSVFSPNICWREECNEDRYKNDYFRIWTECDWLIFEPLPKAVKRNGVAPTSLGFLRALKEGTCKITFDKNGFLEQKEIVSIKRGGYYHIYFKSLFKDGAYPEYPSPISTFFTIERYLDQNRNTFRESRKKN